MREHIDPAVGLQDFQARKIAFFLGMDGDSISRAAKVIQGAYRAFIECECSLVEINPLVVTDDGKLIALDAKIRFDDNALFRHRELEHLRDEQEEDDREVEARKSGISYISLGGNIGCLVNGAGLAMATMDLIKLHGGEPANFLDVGGGAKEEQVTKAFRLILSDERVKAVLVNIFGGIMKCDMVAHGIIEAVKTVSIKVPVVVRIEGTNAQLGKDMLEKSGLSIIPAADMRDAAEKVIKAMRKRQTA
jgi:succinyl-CoA synthetase beta subunit